MADVAKLFHNTVEDESFLLGLTAQDSILRAARVEIRAHLKRRFAIAGEAAFGRVVRPRFFTQGSFAYKTLNDPAWPPDQQMDLDDGCYLPLSFVRGAKPSQAARAFFDFVDGALKELAAEHCWRHEEKPTCVRVVISRNAHVDVPLYAIPDSEFRLLEDRAKGSMHTAARKKADEWGELPSDAVLLAHREEGWKESDPRLIHKWFLDAIDLYRERLRRDCRYLKAWRDHHGLDQLKVSSILLMACVFQAYEAIRGPFLPGREDERLAEVVARLPAYLRGSVANPACRSEDLNRIPAEHRETVARHFEGLAAELRDVVKNCKDQRAAVARMRNAFGDRMPNRPDLVAIPLAGVAKVLSEPKKPVPAPAVGRSVGG